MSSEHFLWSTLRDVGPSFFIGVRDIGPSFFLGVLKRVLFFFVRLEGRLLVLPQPRYAIPPFFSTVVQPKSGKSREIY
jgi:hypothetical protein